MGRGLRAQVACGLAVVAALLTLVTAPTRRAASVNWTPWAATARAAAAPVAALPEVLLTLDRLRVQQPREASGDRPYLATLQFSAEFGDLRPSVSLREAEPHDWITRAPWNAPLLGRSRDHARIGDTFEVPWWMGRFQWRAGRGAALFGAVVLAFDNNNTPPHEIRGILTEFKNRLRALLADEVGGLRLLRGVDLRRIREPDVQRMFSVRVLTMVGRLMGDEGLSFSRAVNLTLGSTFNADRPTGAVAFLFVDLPGLGRPDPPSGGGQPIQGPVRFSDGSTMGWSAWYGEPNALRGTYPVVFVGNGARYSARAQVTVGPRVDAPFNSVQVGLQIGADDMRGASQLHLDVVGAGGRTRRFANFKAGRELPRWSVSEWSLPMPAGWRIGEVTALRFTYASGGGVSTDNVDLVTVRVWATLPPFWGGGTRQGDFLFLQGDTDSDPERSLWRFKGNQPQVTFQTGR